MALSKSFEPTDTVVLLTVFDIAIPDHHSFGVVLLITDSIRRVLVAVEHFSSGTLSASLSYSISYAQLTWAGFSFLPLYERCSMFARQCIGVIARLSLCPTLSLYGS